MGLFDRQKITINSNELKTVPGTRQPNGTPNQIATSIPCTITGTDMDNVTLFILKKYWDKIPGGVHKGFQIVDEATKQCYRVTNEPVWAGGVTHHVELNVEVFVK